MHNPPHPGEVLRDALEGASIPVTSFAAHLGVSRTTLTRILGRRGGVSPEMSMRLSAAFGQSPDLWFKMQSAYDFWMATQTRRPRVRPWRVAA